MDDQPTINQMIALMHRGATMGGCHGEDCLSYRYIGNQTYLLKATGRQPEDINEDTLRTHMVAHFQSLSEDEAKDDIAYINAMYDAINPTEESLQLTQEEIYTLLRVYTEKGVGGHAPKPLIQKLIGALDPVYRQRFFNPLTGEYRPLDEWLSESDSKGSPEDEKASGSIPTFDCLDTFIETVDVASEHPENNS